LYPEFLFPGKSQFTDEPAPKGINIHSTINSVNPLSWLKTGIKIKYQAPDLIIVRFWLPFLGPALGTILRLAKRNKRTKVIAITDNVVPHERRPGDRLFTSYFLGACDGFVAMSDTVVRDLKGFNTRKPFTQLLHPLYDTFGDAVSRETARDALGIGLNMKVMLFFGFIRKYKGLDILLDALNILSLQPGNELLTLLIAGEFYEDETKFQQKIDELGIRERVILRTSYIPANDVKYYFCAADVVIQPYRNATQSGVTPLAYHFEKPMIVTNVGSLASYVPHEKAGLVTEPDARALASTINRYFELGENHFIPHLRSEKKKYTWTEFVNKILVLREEL
jgi:glycosyltransferase involved in cell wall biosynthesis